MKGVRYSDGEECGNYHFSYEEAKRDFLERK
jgi:hypothetical protein